MVNLICLHIKKFNFFLISFRIYIVIIRKKIIKMGAFKDCHRFYNILSPARLNLTSKLFLVFQFVSKTVHFKSFQFHWKLLCNKATKLVFGFCNDYIAIIGWPKLSCRCVMLCFNDTTSFKIRFLLLFRFLYGLQKIRKCLEYQFVS